MMPALLASVAIALCSLSGALLFTHNRKLIGIERYAIPAAVGVFLSLILLELVPEALNANELWGGVFIALGFISFYVLSYVLHDYFHRQEHDDCDRKGAAALLLVGDGIHNLADGVILATAFLIDPTVGVAVTIGIALHEIPQEIVEFGVFIRAGYTRIEAMLRNLISASTVILGTILTLLVFEHAHEYVWVITALAAGNLLYLAASDLLPRIHGSLPNYGSFWYTALSIILGFALMSSMLVWSHEKFGEHETLHDSEVTK